MKKKVVKLVKHCHKRQICKRADIKKYGLLPPKEVESIYWKQLNINLWGPKSIVNVNGFTYELHVMTMVGSTTGWFKQQQLYGPHTGYRC